MAELLNADVAQRALQANLSPRFHRLDRLERYVEGSQYDGRPDFWNDDKPLYERSPCIVYPVAQSAIRSNTDLVLGEGRWPSITAQHEESDEPKPEDKSNVEDGKAKPEVPTGEPKKVKRAKPFDDRFGLSEEESETLNSFIEAVIKQSKLKPAASELCDTAQGASTAIAIGCIRNGRLCIETTKAKWCNPTFDDERPGEVISLEIRYPYLQEYKEGGKWAVRCMLYRRVIDAESDTTFLPLEARNDGEDPNGWQRDDAKSVDHGMGFCPVVWYRYRPACTTVADIDGRAIHAELLEEIDALNFGLSQRHAAAMLASSPPTIETGVDEMDAPGATGRTARIIVPSAFSSEGKAIAGYTDGRPVYAARKRGPGQIWTYPSDTSKVSMLTMPGDSLKPIDDDCRDLRGKIGEAMGVVFVDPDNAKFSGEISGKALARLYDRQVRLCDKIREDFGDNCLLRVVDLLLRIALTQGKKGASSLYLSGLKEALPILERFLAPVARADGTIQDSWFSPPLDLDWGGYFEPDPADEKQLIDTIIAAKNAGLVTRRTCVQAESEIFEIGNVDEYLEALDNEEQETATTELDNQVAKATELNKVPPPKQPPGTKPAANPFS